MTIKNISKCWPRYGDLAHISKAKEDLVRKLRILVDEERRQLEEELALKLDHLEIMKKKHEVRIK